jgi:hypothetical protein
MPEVRVHIAKLPENARETCIAEFGDIAAHSFRFARGPQGLRLTTPMGEVVILPFQGQQIWDATFFGRSLRMKSMFDEPRDTGDFLETYGALLIHCGATAIGPPGEGDTHPPHGELPNARFETAWLCFGEDDAGPYAKLSGSFRHTVAFQTDYQFIPSLRIGTGSTKIDVQVRLRNLKKSPMQLMYLAHVNFRPENSMVLHDNATGLRLREDLPSHVTPNESYVATMARLKQNPNVHRTISQSDSYDPEVVMALDFDAPEAICLAERPDGFGDFIRYDRAALPHAVRWMSRTADQDCLGLALPGTAEPDGLLRIQQNGQARTLGAGEVYECNYQIGSVDADGARRLKAEMGQ